MREDDDGGQTADLVVCRLSAVIRHPLSWIWLMPAYPPVLEQSLTEFLALSRL